MECFLDPKISGRPVAVAGDPEKRHGIVLAKNYEAKKYGVATGEALWQARLKCPDILFVPPHYDEYEKFSKAARGIYCEYTDLVEPFGIDECWLDVSASGKYFGAGEKIANEIKERIKKELGVTVSVGVSFNKVFAKLGSDMKKPDAVTVISKDTFKEKVWPLGVEELLFVGEKTRRKLADRGIVTVGALASVPKHLMRSIMGKNGEVLWAYANGLDTSPVAQNDTSVQPRSVSCGNTSPRDLVNEDDVRAALIALAAKVSSRMRTYGCMADTVTVAVRDSKLVCYEKQKKLTFPCRASTEIFKCAWELFKSSYRWTSPVRSMSIRATGLIFTNEMQMSFDPELYKIQKREMLESAADALDARYGKGTVIRGVDLAYPDITTLHVHSGEKGVLGGAMNIASH